MALPGLPYLTMEGCSPTLPDLTASALRCSLTKSYQHSVMRRQLVVEVNHIRLPTEQCTPYNIDMGL